PTTTPTPTPTITPTNPPGACCCGGYSFRECLALAERGTCSGWGDPCPTATPTPTATCVAPPQCPPCLHPICAPFECPRFCVCEGPTPVPTCSPGPECQPPSRLECDVKCLAGACTVCRCVVDSTPTPTPTASHPTVTPTACFESVGGCCDFGGRRPCY